MAVGLVASYSYAIVTLIETPDGNRFRGWPVYVFCAAGLVIAAAGTFADHRRLTRRTKMQDEYGGAVRPPRNADAPGPDDRH